jgi:hypothetical protein
MKNALGIFFLVLVLLVTPSLVFAGSPWTSDTSYGAKASDKLDFGMKNLLGGWTSIFTEPWNYHKEGKNAFVGAGAGLLNAVVYTVGGALHVITFPVTALDIPLPKNGVPL